MALQIQHGLFKTYTGSSQLTSGTETVITTISGPPEVTFKDDSLLLSIDVKFKHSSNIRAYDSFISGLIHKLLLNYLILDIDKYKTITVNTYTNSTDLSLICNSVLVACLDGGIPLKSTFYCYGRDSLFVIENDQVVLYSGFSDASQDEIDQAKAGYIKESIEYALKDMFEFE